VVYEPVGSTPSPPHSLSGEMIALNHPNPHIASFSGFEHFFRMTNRLMPLSEANMGDLG